MPTAVTYFQFNTLLRLPRKVHAYSRKGFFFRGYLPTALAGKNNAIGRVCPSVRSLSFTPTDRCS